MIRNCISFDEKLHSICEWYSRSVDEQRYCWARPPSKSSASLIIVRGRGGKRAEEGDNERRRDVPGKRKRRNVDVDIGKKYMALFGLRTPVAHATNVCRRTSIPPETSHFVYSRDVTETSPVRPFLFAHVCPGCFAENDCDTIVEMCLDHVDLQGWRTDRHDEYNTTDLAVRDLPGLWKFVEPLVRTRVLPTLRTLFFPGKRFESIKMRIQDLFVVFYDATETDGQRELEYHRDGSLVSFNVALNPPSEYHGGGTLFASGGKNKVVRPSRVGDLIAHCGKILHAGHAITAGQRFILVGFVGVTGGGGDGVFVDVDAIRDAGGSSLDAGRGDLEIIRGIVKTNGKGKAGG